MFGHGLGGRSVVVDIWKLFNQLLGRMKAEEIRALSGEAEAELRAICGSIVERQ